MKVIKNNTIGINNTPLHDVKNMFDHSAFENFHWRPIPFMAYLCQLDPVLWSFLPHDPPPLPCPFQLQVLMKAVTFLQEHRVRK